MPYFQELMQRKTTPGFDALRDLLVTLQAADTIHHTHHWTASGPTFEADHALFARIYEPIGDEVDGLAEKGVALFGPRFVALDEVAEGVEDTIMEHAKGKPFECSLAIEQKIQGIIAAAREALDEEPAGLDNFLAGLADAHDTAIYLLQQRLS